LTTFAEPGTFPPALGQLTFDDLGLPVEITRVLTRDGITTPFEIQAATIPDALAGRDVLGRGQTGSGKTLAFGLPLITRIAGGGRAQPHRPRALILVPTRELAMQVADALTPTGRAVGVFLKTAVGGVPYDRQIDALRRGVEVIVATPGRLGDLIDRGVCSLDDVEITVLDEADQMADMGFLPEVTELLAKTPANAQRLLFSATLDGDVDELVKRFLNDPVTHSTAPAEVSVSTMDHHMLVIPPQEKLSITAAIANRRGKTIVFARTQLGVDRLVEQLAAVGVHAGALHGGKTQRVRTRTLAEFREGRTNVLVATDVAARGIHVDGISLVVHVDPPKDSKDYLHRAGRTARAGESGGVVTLVLPKQRRSTQAMIAKAGVNPAEVRVRMGSAQLEEITGAREPSGVPVVEEPEPRRRAKRSPERGFGQRGRVGDRDRAGDGDRYADRAGTRDQRDRGGARRTYGDWAGGGARSGDGPSGRNSDRAGYGDRGGYGDRPRYSDRADHGDRPRYSDRTDNGDRPRYSERADRGDQPRYSDRTHNGDRPRYSERADRGDRARYGERASYADRASYGEHNRYDRAGEGDRTGPGDRESGGYGDRSHYGDRRPAADRGGYGERRAYGDRGPRDGRSDRGEYGYRGHNSRSGRTGERPGGFRRDDRRDGPRFAAPRPARAY
jgi:superfamily II DNA/RNA helicase